MGLLSRIEGADYKNKSASSILTFNEFLSKNPLDSCCILKKHNDKYFIKNSYGLNSETVINFTSSDDLWAKIVPENNIQYTFNAEQLLLQPFFPFFETNFRKLIKKVILYKNKSNIYLICETNTEKEDYLQYFNDLIYFDNINFSSSQKPDTTSLHKYTFDLSKALDKELSLVFDDKEIYKSALFNGLSNELQTCLPSPNIVEKDDLKLNVYFKAIDDISSNLFLSLIKEDLKNFLVKSYNLIELQN